MSFLAYSTYRDSGVAWIGSIPADWNVCPLLAVVDQCDRSNRGMIENNLLSLSYGSIVRKDINTSDGLLPESFETYQIVEPNDIVWRLTDLQNDKRSLRTAIVRERGIITSAYLATKPREILPAFLSYLLRAYDQEKVFYSMGGGLRQSMKYADVRRMPIIVPSHGEQTAIAAFLDRETAKIDALVERQQRLIELLKEKRQTVISHAVTKGLDPTVPMKDSGVEWLGQVPTHWKMTRLKHRAKVKGRIGFRGYTTDDLVGPEEGAIALGGANLGDGKLRLDDLTYLSWPKYHESPEIMVEMGDIIMGQRGTCGKVSLVDVDIGSATINPSLVVLKEMVLNPSFARYALMADSAQRYLESFLSKTAIPMLTQEQIGNTPMCEPPVEEQQRIAQYLDRETGRIDSLVAEATSAAALLIERRAALISAAVTGKIDVRGATARQSEAA